MRPSTDHTVAAETVLNQKRCQISAATSFLECMSLQVIHHTFWQGHIDPFRTGCIGDSSRAGHR